MRAKGKDKKNTNQHLKYQFLEGNANRAKIARFSLQIKTTRGLCLLIHQELRLHKYFVKGKIENANDDGFSAHFIYRAVNTFYKI